MSQEPRLSSLKSEFVPSTSGSSSHLFLLVHGRTGNLSRFRFYPKRFAIPELSYLLIEAPFKDRSPDQKDEGYSWYLPGFQKIEESRAKIVKTIEELSRQGFDPEKIIWLGFSQGGIMGLDLALRGPYRLTGFECISGLCARIDEYPAAFGPHAKDQRILITHGNRDEIIPLEQAESTYARLKELGVPFEFKIFEKPHSFHLRGEIPLLQERIREWMQG